jgi:hypothetical protein
MFDRFTVNIQDSPANPRNIAFHFDVRFRAGDCVNEIIRNSLKEGTWGPEERHKPYFPFRPQANFDLMILCDPHTFKVSV